MSYQESLPPTQKPTLAGTDTLDRGNTNAKLDSLEKFPLRRHRTGPAHQPGRQGCR